MTLKHGQEIRIQLENSSLTIIVSWHHCILDAYVEIEDKVGEWNSTIPVSLPINEAPNV